MSQVEALDFAPMENLPQDEKPLLDKGNLSIIKNVKVKIEVRVGEAEMTVEELFKLQNGSVVPLTRPATSPIDLLIDGKVVAQGFLVAADDNFGIQITEVHG